MAKKKNNYFSRVSNFTSFQCQFYITNILNRFIARARGMQLSHLLHYPRALFDEGEHTPSSSFLCLLSPDDVSVKSIIVVYLPYYLLTSVNIIWASIIQLFPLFQP
jgi:hypothetical protein